MVPGPARVAGGRVGNPVDTDHACTGPLGRPVAVDRSCSKVVRTRPWSGTVAIDEAARHELYTRLDELLGPGPTSTLMSLLPPVGWADVATKDDLRSLENGLRAEITEVRATLGGEIGELRTEVRTGLAGMRTHVAGLETSLRTEIAEVRIEMHDSMRRLALTLVGAMVSISGITFAANALV